MYDRVASRSGMLRQQMISQSESKGERKMSNREQHEARTHREDTESRSARDIIGEVEDQPTQHAGDIGDTGLEHGDETEAEVEGVQAVEEDDEQDEPITEDDEQDEPIGAEEHEESELAPSFGELLAGSGAVRLRIEPRIMLNVTPTIAEDVPDVVDINGNHYSVASPMRKGNGSEKNPYGLLRFGLADLASFVGNSRDDAMLFGPSSGIESRVSELMAYIDERANELMYSAFEDPTNPEFVFTLSEEEPSEDTEEGDSEDLDNIGVTEDQSAAPATIALPASRSFSVVTWPVYDTDSEDGTIILRPTIAINVNMPILANAQSMLKPLTSMQKIVNNYARESGLGDDDFRLSLVFNTEDIMDDSLLNVLQNFAAEDSEAVIVSGSYLRKCAVDLGHDLYRLFPAGNTAQDAERMLMTNGGDALLLL